MLIQQEKIFNKLKKKLQTLGMKYAYLNNVLNSKLYLHYKKYTKTKNITKIKISKNKIK